MLIGVIFTIAIYGLVVWGIVQIVPMPPQIKQLLIVVATVALFFYALNVLGIFDINAVKVK